MKSKKTPKKLVLGKATVANLEKLQMNSVKGGTPSETPTVCVFTVCRTNCVTNCTLCPDTLKVTVC